MKVGLHPYTYLDNPTRLVKHSLSTAKRKQRFLTRLTPVAGNNKYRRYIASPLRYAGGKTLAVGLIVKLNSYSHQHPPYKALKEFGQIIETIFILRYIDEPDIRQTVEKELNKLEHTNKFAKAVLHDNNHEFRQETREEQLIAEGCKRLIENAIIFWNYLYLSEKVANTPEGKQRDELLQQIKSSSMAVWQHINMPGEYDFSGERVNTITQFHFKIFTLKVG